MVSCTFSKRDANGVCYLPVTKVIRRNNLRLKVSIPNKFWINASIDNMLLIIDSIDHELVHVDDYASGRAWEYTRKYGPEIGEAIMEYKV